MISSTPFRNARDSPWRREKIGRVEGGAGEREDDRFSRAPVAQSSKRRSDSNSIRISVHVKREGYG